MANCRRTPTRTLCCLLQVQSFWISLDCRRDADLPIDIGLIRYMQERASQHDAAWCESNDIFSSRLIYILLVIFAAADRA